MLKTRWFSARVDYGMYYPVQRLSCSTFTYPFCKMNSSLPLPLRLATSTLPLRKREKYSLPAPGSTASPLTSPTSVIVIR